MLVQLQQYPFSLELYCTYYKLEDYINLCSISDSSILFHQYYSKDSNYCPSQRKGSPEQI